MYRSGRRKARKGAVGPIMKDAEFQSQALTLGQYKRIVVSTDSLGSNLFSICYLGYLGKVILLSSMLEY